MKDVKEFYEKKNKHNKPSILLKRFFNMGFEEEIKEKTAIDLGAGVGNDTKFLIEHGYKVTCIDKEELSKKNIENKIENKEMINDIIIEEFEKIKLHKANLIFSNFSLFFCNPNKFDDLMKEIDENLVKGGYFVGNFLGIKDDLNNDQDKTFITKEKLLKYFSNYEIKYISESEYIDKKKENKFWHLLEIFAKKE